MHHVSIEYFGEHYRFEKSNVLLKGDEWFEMDMCVGLASTGDDRLYSDHQSLMHKNFYYARREREFI